jgi:hypothetical protein
MGSLREHFEDQILHLRSPSKDPQVNILKQECLGEDNQARISSKDPKAILPVQGFLASPSVKGSLWEDT